MKPSSHSKDVKLNKKDQNYYSILSSLSKNEGLDKPLKFNKDNQTQAVKMAVKIYVYSECDSNKQVTSEEIVLKSGQVTKEDGFSYKTDLCVTKDMALNEFYKSSTGCSVPTSSNERNWSTMFDQAEGSVKEALNVHLDKACFASYPGTRWKKTDDESTKNILSDLVKIHAESQQFWRTNCRDGHVPQALSWRSQNTTFTCEPAPREFSPLAITFSIAAATCAVGCGLYYLLCCCLAMCNRNRVRTRFETNEETELHNKYDLN